jgi:ABC-type branched-subunit amino acid transport system substrate-binding protein
VTHCGIPDLRAAVTESVRLTSPDVFATQSLNAAYEPESPPDYYKQAFGTDVITHAAFVYLDAGAASFNGKQEIKSWTARGFKFVYTSGIPVTEVNYTSFVAAMQAKGVKYVQYVGAYQEAVLLAKAMQQQGFKAKLVFDPEVYDPGFIQSGGSAVNGAHVWINSALFEESANNPEMQLYEQWLRTTSPGKNPNYFGLFAWAAGELFATEAIKLGGKLTRASLINSLKTVDNYTGNGLFGPQHVGPRMTGGCYQFITLENGKWVREGPSTYKCEGLVHVGT